MTGRMTSNAVRWTDSLMSEDKEITTKTCAAAFQRKRRAQAGNPVTRKKWPGLTQGMEICPTASRCRSELFNFFAQGCLMSFSPLIRRFD